MANTTSIEETPRGGAARTAAQLVVVLDAERPRTPSSRHLLSGVDVVELGRGGMRDAYRKARRLELRVDDRSVSERHARLAQVHGRWVIEDDRSRNGVVVNGKRVERALLADGDVVQLGRTFLLFRDAVAPAPGDDDLVATGAPPLATLSGPLAARFAELARIAPTALPVLLLGETGTGKELLARAVHELSGRRGKLVPVNCAALSPTLADAQLFGHRKGAYTGAVDDRPGFVRAAAGGTLFLDEIGELPPTTQAALLRVLQEKEVTPVGEATPVAVDVRFVAATLEDLRGRIDDGDFRRDLHARLAGYTLELPPLRERREDLGLLVASLLERGALDATFMPAAAAALIAYDWPDNIRELEQALTAATALAGGGAIDVVHLPEPVRTHLGDAAAPRDVPLSEEDAAVRTRLDELLTAHQGNVSRVAKDMEKARWQVHRWMRRFGMAAEKYRR